MDCHITCKNSVHKGTRCPLFYAREQGLDLVLGYRHRARIRVWALEKGCVHISVLQRVLFSGTVPGHQHCPFKSPSKTDENKHTCRNHASVSSKRNSCCLAFIFHSRRGPDNSPTVQFESTTDPVSNRANSDVWLFHLQTQSIQTAQNKRQA